jgi:D-alanyl-D-alanine carboxypeptidase (penicillin-binding protein 5/6)
LKPIVSIVACLGLLASVGSAADAPAPPPENAVDTSPVDPEIPVALLVDLSTGQTLFSREPDRRFVPASVTKVMSVYTAFDLIDRGQLSLDRVVTIDAEVAKDWGGEGSSLFLKVGDQLTVGELLLGITTVSANDGAVALAKAAAGSLDNWVSLMNQNAARLGMHDSHFGLPNGYMDEGRTYTSARDLVRLATALTTRYPALYARFIGHHGLSYHGITQQNHDPITGVVPGADGIKTGYTRQAGYTFLGSAERGGRRLVMVIAGSPSPQIRTKSARQLIEWGFDRFSSRQLLPRGAVAGIARVQNGSARSVPLLTEANVFANLPAGQDGKARLTLRYRGPIEAPIRQGAEVATLRISIHGQVPHDVPLVAGAAVSKANAWQRLRNGLEEML